MRLLAVLVEELESRPDDADRVAALARHLRAVGPDAGVLAGDWLVAGGRPRRPARLTQSALAEAAARLAAAAGTSPWLFDAGRAASAEAAEAIALLLPWPEATNPGVPGSGGHTARRPTLAAWLASWQAAAAAPEAAPGDRAAAVAATIAALDDPWARRWAVRAVCGLARPLASAWQWQRAWALAFGGRPHAHAWAWHRLGALGGAPAPVGAEAFALYSPDPATLPDAPGDAHGELLSAWRRDELWAEPRWPGWRVQVVRRGGDVAVWRRGGGLLNAALPDAWLDPQGWPDPGILDGVLVGWAGAGPGDVADALAAAERRGRARRTALDDAPAAPTLHLVLTDWRRWAGDEGGERLPAERRARLHERWPAFEPGHRDDRTPPAPPPVFTTALVPLPTSVDPQGHASELAALAAAARDAGWSGLVLRHRGARPEPGAPSAWRIRAAPHRVRAVLQYVPSDALAAGPEAAAALAFLACGFALWNRAPLSDAEQAAAMTAAMAGEFLPPPADAPDIEALRLLPLARVPLALPEHELRAIHAGLRANVGTRFGAMHAVAPVFVFELEFAQVRASRRHKLGAVLVAPRVSRWLDDAPPGAAQRVADLDAVRSPDRGWGTDRGTDDDGALA